MAPLLERERELSTLRTLTEHAAAGGSGLLVIEGPAGIGKTRLVAETRREAARSGVNVLTARGGELEQELAFGIVRQLFEDVASGGGEPVPDGAREVFDRPATGVAGEDASFTILHGLYWLTLNLARDRAGPARRRRSAVGRRALAALPGLPGPPARRPARHGPLRRPSDRAALARAPAGGDRR